MRRKKGGVRGGRGYPLAADQEGDGEEEGELQGESPRTAYGTRRPLTIKSTPYEDIPERDIEYVNFISTIKQRQTGRAGGGQVGDFLCQELFTVFRAFVLPAFVSYFPFYTGHNLKVACCMNNK